MNGTQSCCICLQSKRLDFFNDRPDGSGKKHICRNCEIRKRAEMKSRGIRKCSTCGKPTINYRCARCWREFYGLNPLDANVASDVDGIAY